MLFLLFPFTPWSLAPLVMAFFIVAGVVFVAVFTPFSGVLEGWCKRLSPLSVSCDGRRFLLSGALGGLLVTMGVLLPRLVPFLASALSALRRGHRFQDC